MEDNFVQTVNAMARTVPCIDCGKKPTICFRQTEDSSFEYGFYCTVCESEPICYKPSVVEAINYWNVMNVEDIRTGIKADMVNHPPHYTKGGIECIDGIRASMTDEAFLGYLKGNVLKYLWRYESKHDPAEDLQKALWYLNKMVDILKENHPDWWEADDLYDA